MKTDNDRLNLIKSICERLQREPITAKELSAIESKEYVSTVGNKPKYKELDFN